MRFTPLTTRLIFIASTVYHSVLPNQCLLCKQEILAMKGCDTSRRLCPKCHKLLEKLQIATACNQCALPLDASHYSQKEPLCGECMTQAPSFDRTRVIFEYGYPSDYLINQLKQHNKPHAGCELAHYWSTHFFGQISSEPLPDVVTCVPLHASRLLIRQYNQSDVIARHILKHKALTSVAYMPHILLKTTSNPPQQSLNRKERLKNLKYSFALNPQYLDQVKNKHIVVVDDVVTTGATAHTVSVILKKAGASRVDIWALARTPKAR